MQLIKYKNYFLGFSGALVLVSIICVFIFGLRQGIDLRGGIQWQVSLTDENVSESAVHEALRQVTPDVEVSVKQTGDGDMILRMPPSAEASRAGYEDALQKLGGFSEKSFSNIGPTIGEELRAKALWAILFVLLGISLYIAYAFRKVSEPVKSWKYGIVTLVTLFHDVAIPAGLFAVLGSWKGVEVDTNFIVALLVVMGFSVHDTIVVFDRIRENLMLHRGKRTHLADIINKSVTETIARSVNTSLTLFLVLIALLFVGPPTLFYFILTILIGTIFGTYSSIFVASPLLYLWGRKQA